ncbi:hypothetical protein WL93_02655 [Burkholderia diffusa]|nr:hypothetical protein WL93_02655 [Burkholderia diffusa]
MCGTTCAAPGCRAFSGASHSTRSVRSAVERIDGRAARGRIVGEEAVAPARRYAWNSRIEPAVLRVADVPPSFGDAGRKLFSGRNVYACTTRPASCAWRTCGVGCCSVPSAGTAMSDVLYGRTPFA